MPELQLLESSEIFEEALNNWDNLLFINIFELTSVSEKLKTIQTFFKDYNDGEFWVQQPDDIFVIPPNIEKLWQDLLQVVEESIRYQLFGNSLLCN